MAAVPDRGGGAQAGRRLARRISPALGGAARPPRRLSEDAASQGNAREKSVSARNSIDLEQDPRSIIGTRVFDAPRDLVFSAFTDPKHLAQWWGPDGFTTTTSAFEFRPGGVWRFVMHGPDGRDYQNRITFDEIVAPERHRLSPRRRRRRRAGAVHADAHLRGSRRQDPAHLARHVPVGGRTRARDQGIRRRQGPGADHGAARRLRGGEWRV